jgi:hypothetical protein
MTSHRKLLMFISTGSKICKTCVMISRKMEDEVKKIVGGLRAIEGEEDKDIIRYVILYRG